MHLFRYGDTDIGSEGSQGASNSENVSQIQHTFNFNSGLIEPCAQFLLSGDPSGVVFGVMQSKFDLLNDKANVKVAVLDTITKHVSKVELFDQVMLLAKYSSRFFLTHLFSFIYICFSLMSYL